MTEWKKSTCKPARSTPEARLQLTEHAVITVTDYGWSDNRILGGLYCRLDAMEGPLDQACDSVPAQLLLLLEEALLVLRALVNSENEQVDFPAAVDPVGAIEEG